MSRLPDAVISETNELLSELMLEVNSHIDLETEVCVPMLTEKGVSKEKARNMLAAKLAAGELTWRFATYNGQRVKAYKKV